MLWNKIANLPGCQPVQLGKYPQFYLFTTSLNGTGWLVGPYKYLTPLATELRGSSELGELLAAKRVRLGLRDTDVPPTDLERQPRYGASIPGANLDQDFTSARVNPLAPPVKGTTPPPVNRKTDRQENVKRFWDSQTPQSHHIVEFNNLETLGVSRQVGIAEMDYQQLPAVLLAAEFHQRYLSAILKPAQHWQREKLQTEMVGLYRNLYQDRSALFEPLWQVSKVILQETSEASNHSFGHF
jgi:hypothetical protein